MLLFLLFACDVDDHDKDGDDVVGTYEMGWPIGACADDLDDAGTGHGVGEVLPQYELYAQTGELVKLHDFCNQVVYLEFGYFT